MSPMVSLVASVLLFSQCSFGARAVGKRFMDPAIPPSQRPGSHAVYYELYQIGWIALVVPIFWGPLASNYILLFGLSVKGCCGDAKVVLGAFNLTCASSFLLSSMPQQTVDRSCYIHSPFRVNCYWNMTLPEQRRRRP